MQEQSQKAAKEGRSKALTFQEAQKISKEKAQQFEKKYITD